MDLCDEQSLIINGICDVGCDVMGHRSARRKAMHEDIFKSPHAIHGHITAYLEEIQALSNKAADGRRVQQQQRCMGWIAPPDDLSKLNVDAAVIKGQGGAVGAVCRSKQGVFLGASAIVFNNIDDPTTLEALAIREGL